MAHTQQTLTMTQLCIYQKQVKLYNTITLNQHLHGSLTCIQDAQTYIVGMPTLSWLQMYAANLLQQALSIYSINRFTIVQDYSSVLQDGILLWYMDEMHIKVTSMNTVLTVVELLDFDIFKCQASKNKQKWSRPAQTVNTLFLFFRPRRAFFLVVAAKVSESTEALWMLMSSKSDSSRKSSSLFRRKKKTSAGAAGG